MSHLPISLSPRQAIERLQRVRWLNARAAIARLQALAESAQILSLYRHYFPRRYAVSKKSMLYNNWQVYSPRELEFMELVEKRLFPLASDVLADSDERYPYLPICSQAIDMEDTARLRPALQLLIGLVGGVYADVNWDELLTHLSPGSQLPMTSVDACGQYEVDWEKFETECARLGGPMKHIGMAFSIVTYSTGNFWLDYTDEILCYGNYDFPWTVEATEYLAAEWKQAEAMTKTLCQVLDWLEARPGCVAQLITTWNASLHPAESEGHHHEET